MASLAPATKHLAAERLAEALIGEYGLEGWRFEWDGAKARAGQCVYSKKVISLSLYYIEWAAYMEYRDTILHEIAHALTPKDRGHGREWKWKCLQIGATPERLLGEQVSERPWEGYCGACGVLVCKRHRRRRNLWHVVRNGGPYGGPLYCGEVEWRRVEA